MKISDNPKLSFNLGGVRHRILLKRINPPVDFTDQWRFTENPNPDSSTTEGFYAFKKLIMRASVLHRDDAYRLLFADGLLEGESGIAGNVRFERLASRRLADPDLLWSLLFEKGQKTLRYLHNTFGAVCIEALRRRFVDENGVERFLYVSRRPNDGSWHFNCYNMRAARNKKVLVLVLG